MNFTIDLPSSFSEWAVLITLIVFVIVPVLILTLAVGIYLLRKIPPIRRTMDYILKLSRESLEVWLAEMVREGTKDIRQQVFPNGGTSLSDKLDETLDIVDNFDDRMDRMMMDIGMAQSKGMNAQERVQALENILMGENYESKEIRKSGTPRNPEP